MTLLTRLSVGLFCDEKSFIIHTKFADERIEHRYRRYSDIRGQESLVDATPLELFDSQAVFEFFKKIFWPFLSVCMSNYFLDKRKISFFNYFLCALEWMKTTSWVNWIKKEEELKTILFYQAALRWIADEFGKSYISRKTCLCVGFFLNCYCFSRSLRACLNRLE